MLLDIWYKITEDPAQIIVYLVKDTDAQLTVEDVT